MNATHRTFDSGATRNLDAEKLDYEGFYSPLVLERYAQYMHANRKLPDGSMRGSDNWMLGIPLPAYMKSLLRHVISAWKRHRGYGDHEDLETALCGVLFNASGYLHELLARGHHPSAPALIATVASGVDADIEAMLPDNTPPMAREVA
jgi:hypothetical protein